MKTLSNLSRLILMAGFIFSVSLLAANNTPVTGKKNKEAEKTIHDYFKFPGVLVPLHSFQKADTQKKVEVLFSTDPTGRVDFVLAKTSDRELKAEIERQFSKLRINNLKSDVVNSVTLNFRTQ